MNIAKVAERLGIPAKTSGSYSVSIWTGVVKARRSNWLPKSIQTRSTTRSTRGNRYERHSRISSMLVVGSSTRLPDPERRLPRSLMRQLSWKCMIGFPEDIPGFNCL